MDIKSILKKYYGYDQFRPLQEEIILSVLNGNDTLALLPTGGGKSVCFQVPALALNGVCIVVSPLIALMKDQVENLRKKGIKANYLISGMSMHEVDKVLDLCVYNETKFLYVSPERLQSEIFLERFQRMKVGLIAVDEAHCISQWGYDFRPPYLQIADIRLIHPQVPVLALTATATNEVRIDIMEKLQFKTPTFFVKSFERSNLQYQVIYIEDKLKGLLELAKKHSGTGIVYVRNRKLCKEISDFLNRNQIKADYYHAGLDANVRSIKQELWINNKVQIIVATNAFGMGIDKPDVRFVIHIDLPDSLEAYYQEAGRGGRDEQQAMAYLLYHSSDGVNLLKKSLIPFPQKSDLDQVYQSLMNYFSIAIGNTLNDAPFDLLDFTTKFQLNPLTVIHCLKLFERDGIISYSDEIFLPSRLMFLISGDEVLSKTYQNKEFERVVHAVLRTYGGIFQQYVRIHEKEIADKINLTKEKVIEYLHHLTKIGWADYAPLKNKPLMSIKIPRTKNVHALLDANFIEFRKNVLTNKIQSVIRYADSKNTCRSKLLLEYFDEKKPKNCGQCDVCLGLNELEFTTKEYETITSTILKKYKHQQISLRILLEQFPQVPKNKFVEMMRHLNETGEIEITP